MTQIIIYDESEINALIKERESEPLGSNWATDPKYSRLRREVYDNPTADGNSVHTNVVTFLSHHYSQSPFIKRIQRSEGMNNREWNNELEKALSKIYGFYLNKTISGDLLIHKTHSTAKFELEQWPIVRKRRTKYEAWFITGMTGWIDDILNFVREPNTCKALESWNIERKRNWLLTHSKIPEGLLKHHRNTSQTNMLFKRAYWVRAIRKYHNAILWREVIWNGVPRAGIAVYINGRAYCVQYGKDLVNFKIYQRANRYDAQEIGLPFAPYVSKSEHQDDPDFVKRFTWWKHNRSAGRAIDVDCDPADMWPEESSPNFLNALMQATRQNLEDFPPDESDEEEYEGGDDSE
tara:strand:+ start:4827 stop:5876 length:1050 start_codon:yes stop_codon:yes gene_type:complete